MKNLADLKRALVPGSTITMVRHDWYPNGYLLNKPRKVLAAKSVGITIETVGRDGTVDESHMRWQNASEYTFVDDDYFEVTIDPQGSRMGYVVSPRD